MNGQRMNYSRYYEQLKTMEAPVLPSQLPNVTVDLGAISKYAKKKGVHVYELTDSEKSQFLKRKE